MIQNMCDDIRGRYGRPRRDRRRPGARPPRVATRRSTVLLDPSADHHGTVALRLSTVTDHSGQIRPGGPAVTATVDNPGGTAAVSFDGRAGQRVEVTATSVSGLTLGCAGPDLIDPAGRTVARGCLIQGRGGGGIDPYRLAATGRYTILVDPDYGATGSVRLQLRTTP